jgi:Flp pilus assembly protein TadG
MPRRFCHFPRDRRASTAVEFALVSVLFLLPLLLASADFVAIISAQAQMNTALQALYYFAVTTTGDATNATEAGNVISAINSAGTQFQVTMPANLPSGAANPSYTYVCYTYTAGSAPTFSTPSTSNTCSGTQTAMYFANYEVTTKIVLPFPIPGVKSPLTLIAQGSVQTQ